jgi:hypothetical protein
MYSFFRESYKKRLRKKVVKIMRIESMKGIGKSTNGVKNKRPVVEGSL